MKSSLRILTSLYAGLLCISIMLMPTNQAFSQVEKIGEFNEPSQGILRDMYSPLHSNYYFNTRNRIVNNKLVYNIGSNLSWVFDAVGNLERMSGLGWLTDLGNERWLSSKNDQIFVLDTSNFELIPLFDEKGYKLGSPQNGLQLLLEGDGEVKKLWVSDGDPDNLLLLANEFKTSKKTLENAMSHNGHWSFIDADGRLYLSDGTVDGTNAIRNLDLEMEMVGMTNQYIILYANEAFRSVPYDGSSMINVLTFSQHNIFARGNTKARLNLNNRVLFVANVSGKGETLWSVDGTQSGSRKLATVPRIFPFGYHTPLIRLGEKAIYCYDNYTDDRILETDGTQAGTQVISEKGKGLRNIAYHEQFGDDQMAFAFKGWTEQPRLWLLKDGQFKDCTPGTGFGWGLEQRWHGNRYFEAGQHHLYYMALHPEAGRELHRTNSEGESELVVDLNPGTGWSNILLLGQLGDWFYFAAMLPEGVQQVYRVRDDQPIVAEIPSYDSFFEWAHTFLPFHSSYSNSEATRPRDLLISGDSVLYSLGYLKGRGYGHANSLMFESFFWMSTDFEDIFHPNNNTFYLVRMNAHTGNTTWIKTLQTGAERWDLLRLAEAPDEGIYYSTSSRFANGDNIGSLSHVLSDGEETWTINGEKGTQIQQLQVDNDGNIFASFWLARGGLSFGDFPFIPYQDQNADAARLGIAKIHPDGKVLWARELPESGLITTRKCLLRNNRLYLSYITSDQKMRLIVLSTDWGDLIRITEYNTTGALVPTAMTELEDGRICLTALTSGSTKVGKYLFETNPEEWRSLVMFLSREGQLLLDIHSADPEELLYDVAADESGGYVVAGVENLLGASIPGLDNINPGPYFRRNFTRFFVRSYNQQHTLNEEKSWLQNHIRSQYPLPLREPDFHLLKTGTREYVIQHSYTGPLDTLRHAPPFFNATGAHLMSLRFTELSPVEFPASDEPLRFSEVQLYPNPATDIIVLHSQHQDFAGATLHLFNSQGISIPISETPALGQHRFLQVGNLPTGVYFLGVRINNAWDVQRVLIHSSAR